MFNPKISGIVAGAAFVLSLLIGLFSGSQFLFVLVRALILAFVFFILASLSYWLITQYIPELLSSARENSAEMDDPSAISPGSRVDISVDSSMDEAPLGQYRENSAMEAGVYPESPGQNGGIDPGNTPIQGMDQIREDDYNRGGGDFNPPKQNGAEFVAVPGNDAAETVDVLPDMESMSGYFDSSPSEGGEDEVIGMEDDFPALSASASSRKKKSNASDDFNVQEMASAIQTILKRDQKG